MWSVALEAQRLLAELYGVSADVWAVTSWTNLRTDALEVERWNRLHPEEPPRTAHIAAALGDGLDPVVAITDYMRSVPDQVGAVRRTAVHLARYRRLRSFRRQGHAPLVLRG